MFKFQFSGALYWLFLLIPLLLILVYQLYRKRKIAAILGHETTVKKLISGYSTYKFVLKFIIISIAIGFLIVGWANPQWGSKKVSVEQKGIDIFIALDISQSMLAEDIAPNRLDRSKRFINQLIDKFKGNRIGLIYFAGTAFLQMPLSADYAAAKLFIQSANPEMVSLQGTSIGEAIDLSMRNIGEDDGFQKILIVISDGESHDEAAVEKAREAKEKGIQLYTIGVGSEDGALIPYTVRGRSDYKRDKSGNPVKTKLNPDLLLSLAAAAKGSYYNIESGNKSIIETLKGKVDKLNKKTFEQKSFTDFESYFQYFIAIGLALILLEMFISERKTEA